MEKLALDALPKLRQFLGKKPHDNLFLLGDLEMFGFDDRIQSFYGRYDDFGNLKSVIFRFRADSLHIVAEDFEDADFQMARALVEKHHLQKINCTEDVYLLWGDALKTLTQSFEKSTMAVYKPKHEPSSNNDIVVVQKHHAQAMHALLKEGFKEVSQSLEDLEKSLPDERQTWACFDGDTMVSVASAVAPTADAIMIIGVTTHVSYRQQGYGSRLVKHVADTCLAQGRRSVLFYTNPVAASIYLNLGFIPLTDYYLFKV